MPSDRSGRPSVILLAYYYPPQNTSGAARPARFARRLPDYGCPVRVVSAGDIGIEDGAPGVWRVPSNDGRLRQADRMSTVAAFTQRLLLPYEEHLPWVPYAAAAVSEILAEEPVCAVISTSPPIATHLAALVAKKRHGIRWIADFRDPMADNPFRQNWRSRIYDPILERAVFEHADVIIANTEPVGAMWRKKYPAAAEKIHVIWNGFDDGEALPARQRPAVGRRTIAHIGAVYGERHPAALLASMRRLIAAGRLSPSDVLVRMVGLIENPAIPLENPVFAEPKAMGFFEYTGKHVSRAQSFQEMADADSLLLLDLNARGFGGQLPAKIFDYVRAGLPVLAFTVKGSATESVLSRSGLPHRIVYSGEPEAEIDRKVQEFFAIPPCLTAPSAWFLEQFEARKQAQVLASLVLGEQRCESSLVGAGRMEGRS